MDNEQFEVLVGLMRGNLDAPANMAARAVLVDGMEQAEAVRQFGVTRATVSQAVLRYRTADARVRSVYLKKGKKNT